MNTNEVEKTTRKLNAVDDDDNDMGHRSLELFSFIYEDQFDDNDK